MESISELLEEMGLNKTSKHDKILLTYETPEFVCFDSPYCAGGRFVKLKVNIKEDRDSIQIIATDHCLDEYTLYEGFCKTVEYFKLIMLNIFGGDGETPEDVNNQFNGRLQ